MRRALGFMGAGSSRAQRLSCCEQPGRRSRPCGLRVALASASQGTRALCPGHCRYGRLALACLLLKAGDECAQRRLSRLGSRCTRRGYGQARIDLGEAPMARDVSASPNDAIGERDVRFSATELAHLEARSALAPNIEPAAITLGREE